MTPALKAAALALLAVMVVHVAVRPEHGWILLSTCDVAVLATAFGILAGTPRIVAIAWLFSVMIGMPAFTIGLFTTYELNPTGVVVHIAPPVLGAIVIVRHGLPRNLARDAFAGYLANFFVGMLVAPPALNVNFAAFIWPPLAGLFATRLSFYAAIFAATLLLLVIGELLARRLFAARAKPAPQAIA
jgi:hypothetical protein